MLPIELRVLILVTCIVVIVAVTIRAVRLRDQLARAKAVTLAHSQELSQTTVLLQTLLKVTEGPIYAKDRAGRMVLANEATLRLIGTPWEEIVGRTDLDFLENTEQGQAIVDNDQRIMAAGVSETLEEIVNAPTGATHIWLSTKSPMIDEAGAVIGLVGVSVDITARKQTEAELRDLNDTLTRRVEVAVSAKEAALKQLMEAQKVEVLGKLTGWVAHDLNNLLTPIIGGLDMITRKLPDDERLQRVALGAAQSADRAKTLVQRLLAFGRRQTLQSRAVDLKALIIGMKGLVDQTAGPNIQVFLDLPSGLPAIEVDPAQLELAILNLCVNARDAMPSGGKLLIAADLSDAEGEGSGGPYLALRVVDTGEGMSADVLAQAIEPFFTTKEMGQGTGLGLSMVSGLAAQSGGKFVLKSTIGQGTTAELLLPLANTLPEMTAAPATTGKAAHVASVLLVDDEEVVRMTLAEGLRDDGFKVIEAANGAEALALLKDGLTLDILVTDHMMPEMTGAALANAAKADRPDLPVLIITGFTNLTASESSGLEVLHKPFSPAELANRIASLCAKWAA